MKLNPEEIHLKKPKQLRTLRNQLNNRISAMEAGKEVELSSSHPLHNLDIKDCQEILIKVKRALKAL